MLRNALQAAFRPAEVFLGTEPHMRHIFCIGVSTRDLSRTANKFCSVLLTCLLALLPQLASGQKAGEIPPKSDTTFENTYEWDGEELCPKSGADFSNTYVWDGRELEPKSGASFQTTWTFDGEEWEPKSSGSLSEIWVVEGHVPVPVAALVVLGKIGR